MFCLNVFIVDFQQVTLKWESTLLIKEKHWRSSEAAIQNSSLIVPQK